MRVTVDLKKETLSLENKTYKITCIVRNEKNGWRKPSQVIRSIPDNSPIYPRQYPKGTWNIYSVIYTNDPEFAPVKIKTNATQMLPVWELDESGHYKSKTDEYIRDEAYWLHYSAGSSTTLGCIRLDSERDAYEIAGIIEKQLINDNCVELDVI